ncbi:MAG TPA: tetratricopeptide repeat protein [Puia sp.]|nr:tetratricopeptide repeat protein [Puia sp.]
MLNTRPSILFLLTLFVGSYLKAQTTDALIRRGNRFYNKQEYEQSQTNYEKALKKSPGNPDAHFNLGDALYRKNDYEKAAGSYDDVLQSKADENIRQSAYYNKGVAMIRQKKIDESIDAWKNALRLNSADSDARENLVKALLEKKKQEQQQQQNKKDNPDKKKSDDKQKKDQNKPDNSPKPQQSKLSKQQVEQYLKSLEQREKDVQDKMNQNKTHTLNQPEKDW